MNKKSSTLIYLILTIVVAFCLITVNLFIYFKNINKLYEDKYLRVDNTYINYPYFDNEKDIYIEEYLNIIDASKTDNVKYLVNYLGDYTNIIFKLYKNDLIVDYYSITFNKKNKVASINDLITDEELLISKVKMVIETNALKISMDEYNYAKKSYLFKDKEMDIYLSNYDEKNSITLITINYWELKENLAFPYKLDKKYKLMSPVIKNEDEKGNPIIPPKDLKPKKLVAFSFDDGPSKYTLELLDILDEFDANATFFLVGYNIKIRNSVVLEMFDRGFEIGNHTIDHSRLTKFDCEKANEKINQNDELFVNITNKNMNLFRPPYGAINDKLQACISQPIILWSVDSRDWESRNTEKIITEVLSNIKEGDVVLFHDLYPTTIDAIKILLPILYADGFQVVSVSELFNANSIPLENHQIYHKAS